MGGSWRDGFNRFIERWDSRWSIAAHLWSGVTLMASAGIPAWATWASGIFSQYAPLSWVVAGFCGLLLWGLARLLMAWAYRTRVNAAYDARFVDRVGNYNPIDLIIEKQKI